MTTTSKRSSRAEIARETHDILQRGRYEVRGRTIDVSAALQRAVARSIAYTPADVDDLLARGSRAVPGSGGRVPRIEVTGETTLQAGRRLLGVHPRVLCLNFASARSPGGGFLSGARAQEESLCRASCLYATLIANAAYYDANRTHRDVLYTDWAIYSPGVPVIRDDAEGLLEEPFDMSFVTMPAPNRGAMRRPDDAAVGATLRRRVAAVLAIAARHEHDALVLGAWGCGAFRNDPVMVARTFREVLDERAFASAFERIVFAVFEVARDHGNRAAFEGAFGAK